MMRVATAFMIAVFFATSALAQTACGDSGCRQRRQASLRRGQDCVHQEVQEGRLRAEGSQQRRKAISWCGEGELYEEVSEQLVSLPCTPPTRFVKWL